MSKPRAFWQLCCNSWAFTGMIDLCEAIRKECEISRFQLPARGWHPTWHSFFCLHSETGRESGWSPRYLTRLTWDCSHPGMTGWCGREGTKPQWTSLFSTGPLGTLEDRALDTQKWRESSELPCSQNWRNHLGNNWPPSPAPDVITRSPSHGSATCEISRLCDNGATG